MSIVLMSTQTIDTQQRSPFYDLPVELQQHIVRFCLGGWKATLEKHEKADRRSTARIWSSCVYDALMLSLTCKHFHRLVQDIQADPKLFSGELDLIEVNGDLSDLLGYSTNAYELSPSRPRPPYRTQVFVKDFPYREQEDPDWKLTRASYHREIRQLIIENVHSMAIYFDEIDANIPWAVFGNLRHLTLYWPFTVFDLEDGNPDHILCAQTNEDLLAMLESARDYKDILLYSEFTNMLRKLEEPVPGHISVTLKLEAPHNHYTLEELQGEDGHELNRSADYYNMKITCSYGESGLKLLSTKCDGQRMVPGSWDERSDWEALYELEPT
ncbi:hypothetical protein PMZ80_010678 [Knufia obscura]|uniref:F-box domain-containing protein n=1 Tax=Knufia obscura TaxID=1635080 RepID=A0ABR0R961_9EURO|nr:hypothetical protein PMZ80_010678 [Knufia obscura]